LATARAFARRAIRQSVLHPEHGDRWADAGIHYDAGRAEGSQRFLDQAGAFFTNSWLTIEPGRFQDSLTWVAPRYARCGAYIGFDVTPAVVLVLLRC